ncbi:hypothetical protein [Streptomyces sp. NPDC001843]|uniref:hypothetical protein n=1 Tax=Streptomyces sp. NPDC001843 TaxID=3364617 RepID=UPI0036746556
MGEPKELRQRVDALEALVDQVDKQQAVTRHLAETAEIDGAALRDHRRHDMDFMRVMRETRLRHSELLRALVAGRRRLLEHFGITQPEQ